MRSDDEQVEAHLERHRRRLEEHEASLAATRDQLSGSDDSDDGTVGTTVGAGLLAVLGLGAGAGTVAAQSDPQGQVGTADRPVETVHVAALSGPLTGGERVGSLVGNGLTVENGTLGLTGGE